MTRETSAPPCPMRPRFPSLAPRDFGFIGQGLRRPECLVALSDGSVLASDKGGLVTRLAPDGTQENWGSGAEVSNTFALCDDGGLIIADIGKGALLRADATGRATLLHNRYQGERLGAVNYVLASETSGEFYVSISTKEADFKAAIHDPRPDGRIMRLDASGIALVADGLWFPNAMQIDPARGFLYVAETTAGAISRAEVRGDGTLGVFSRHGPAPLFPGAYTDGLALDAEGNVWITELSRNGVHVIDQKGDLHTVFEDPTGKTLRAPTDLAFGGADLSTVYVGSLKMARLAYFRTAMPGLPMRHWRRDFRLAGRAAD